MRLPLRPFSFCARSSPRLVLPTSTNSSACSEKWGRDSPKLSRKVCSPLCRKPYSFLTICLFLEHTVGNVVRKVLHNIREEYNTATKGAPPARNVFSISKFVLQGQPRKQIIAPKSESTLSLREDDPDDPDSFAKGLKPVLMEAIQDVLDELETVYDNVSKTAKDHIHSEYVRVLSEMQRPCSCLL